MKAVVEWIALLMVAMAAGLAGAAAPVTFGFPPVFMDIAFVIVTAVILAVAFVSFWRFARALKDEDLSE